MLRCCGGGDALPVGGGADVGEWCAAARPAAARRITASRAAVVLCCCSLCCWRLARLLRYTSRQPTKAIRATITDTTIPATAPPDRPVRISTKSFLLLLVGTHSLTRHLLTHFTIHLQYLSSCRRSIHSMFQKRKEIINKNVLN